MLIISLPIAGFTILASRIKFYQLVYFIGTLLLVHLSYTAEINMATKDCVKKHNQLSDKIEFDANCYKEDESKSDADSKDPDEHMCFIMRRYCARRCTTSVYGRKCEVESLFTLNLEEEDDGSPVTLDCICSYKKYKRGCLSTYQMTWDEVLEEFEANCSKSPSKELPLKVLFMGGMSGDTMEIYNPSDQSENRLINRALNPERLFITGFVLKDQIFTVGGYYNAHAASECEIYNLKEDKLSPCARLKYARGGAASVVVGDVVYVCGGHATGYVDMNSCESYQSGIWSQSVAPMLTARYFMAMAVIQDSIYAIGGQANKGLGEDGFDVVERYSISSNTWSTDTPMSTARIGPSAAVVDDVLYTCGGIGLNDCEKYTQKDKKWVSMKEKMNYIYYYFNLIASGDLLFAFGGDDAGTSVEMFDIKTQKWSIRKRLMDSRKYSLAIVVP